MSGVALVRPVRSILWELRFAWATGKRISVTLDDCDIPRQEGHVRRVAPTGAFVNISGTMIPAERILAVHLPSMLADSNAPRSIDPKDWNGPALREIPQREQLPGLQDGAEPSAERSPSSNTVSGSGGKGRG